MVISGLANGQGDPSQLTLQRIFTDFEFFPKSLGPTKWIDEGAGYTTLEASATVDDSMDLVRYQSSTGKRSILVSASDLVGNGGSETILIEDYSWSDDRSTLLIYTNSQRVWRQNTRGEYWVYQISSKKLKKLGSHIQKPSTLMFAKFSPQGDRVAYVSENNLFIEEIKTDKLTQLTYDGTRDIINGTFDWVYEEEFSCQDGFRWSPDGQAIAYWQLDASDVQDFYMINNTDSIYSYLIPVQYPKVGEANSSCKIGVVSAKGGQTTWMAVEGDPQNNYIPRMEWADNSNELIVQQLNRAQNQNKVILCNAASGKPSKIYEDNEEAWLDVVDDLHFMKSGSEFTWVSQKNGWQSVYSVDRSTGKEKLITPGNFDVVDVLLLDQTGGWIYYIASPTNATQRYLYRNKLSGKITAERLTPKKQSGTHKYNIGPSGKWALHTYSQSGKTPTTDLISLPNHKVQYTLISNDDVQSRVQQLSHNPVEFFSLPAEDGLSLDAYMIKPIDFDPNKKYPVLFHVYGEPWGQTVLDSWGSFTYLYHLFLAQQGYVIMSVDNRGTPGPKGREWRKSVHGAIGVQSSADQASAVSAALKRFTFLDSERVGIWGWSGGGSMTLNALFRYPEIYKMGVSVAPVANQLLYDNVYQERYSGLPSENMDGYVKGSPITYAKNLKGDLLLIHGTGDDNVHYQNTEMLINELIRHNKLFSVMPYPNRSHGIYEGENTFRHVYEVMHNYIKKNLPAGPQ